MRWHRGILKINIFCLDAPAVALVWQEAFARSHGVTLMLYHRLILALSVWLAYSADRWLDARSLRPEAECAERHRFHHHYPWWTPSITLLVFPLLLILAYVKLTHAEWMAGLPLLLAVGIYLSVSQLLSKTTLKLPIKEMAVAILFAWGTALFALSKPLIGGPYPLLPIAGFALLCFLNCWVIGLWEKSWDEAQGQLSLAICLPHTKILFPFAAGGFAIYLGDRWILTSIPSIMQALALSALLLTLLNGFRKHLPTAYRTALADWALLTPLFLFPYWFNG